MGFPITSSDNFEKVSMLLKVEWHHNVCPRKKVYRYKIFLFPQIFDTPIFTINGWETVKYKCKTKLNESVSINNNSWISFNLPLSPFRWSSLWFYSLLFVAQFNCTSCCATYHHEHSMFHHIYYIKWIKDSLGGWEWTTCQILQP